LKIGIIGTGNVAQALAKGFVKSKHEVTFGSREPTKSSPIPGTKVQPQRDAVRSGEVVVLAVYYPVIRDLLASIGTSEFKGKTVVDVTNVMGPNGEWTFGFTTSAAEEIARQLPQAHVVKAFNTHFAKHMSTGKLGNEQLTLLIAGDDVRAKETVMGLGREIGFDAVDAGPLRAARYLEPMGLLNIALAFVQKMGPDIGFRLARSGN
jgi:8-hydroxy-5-deazaflavin:NADPH oxidoreductase